MAITRDRLGRFAGGAGGIKQAMADKIGAKNVGALKNRLKSSIDSYYGKGSKHSAAKKTEARMRIAQTMDKVRKDVGVPSKGTAGRLESKLKALRSKK